MIRPCPRGGLVGLAGLIGVLAGLALASSALAWGATGHRIIGRLATEALPPSLPGFLRSPAAVAALGELDREPDRWKAAGKAHDLDLDPGHFLDLGDDGRVLAGPALADLPATREDYETALRRIGGDGWRAGYLPYSIIEGWQQLAKDFAYWRVDVAAARTVVDAAHRTWFVADEARREGLVLRDLGVLGHYVGDGSQPLHVSEHFNGWGAFPNPDGFTQDKVHAPFEGAFVRSYVRPGRVRAAMAPYRDCHCSIQRRTVAYLAATNAFVVPFYRLYKAGGFQPGDRRGVDFAAERLAAGAAELRDVTIDAWRASAEEQVGFPAVSVRDVEAGALDPYDSFYGTD
ncbi:MAG: phospholipase C/P1 nuclease family protein [Caulobacteraceae bacterium]